MSDRAIERLIMTSALWVKVLPWRNDPLVYVWNRADRVIGLEEHISWFENRKKNLVQEPIFAYFDKSSFVGVARLDLTSISTYEVGIIVNPDLRGVGYGKAILSDICDFLSSEEYSRFEVLAYIHTDNTSSRFLFESFSFVLKARIGRFDILQWIPLESST